MPTSGRDHIVPRLRAAIEADNGSRTDRSCEVIDQRSFAAVTEGKADDDGVRCGHEMWFTVNRLS